MFCEPAGIELNQVNLFPVPEHPQNGIVLRLQIERELRLDHRAVFGQGIEFIVIQLEKDREAAVLRLIHRLLPLRAAEHNLCRTDDAEHEKDTEHDQHGQRKISAGILPEIAQKPLCQYAAHQRSSSSAAGTRLSLR